MKKVLESYYKLRDTLIGEGYSYTEDLEPMLEIEKSLLVLKTIKEKQVNVFIFLHSGDLATYNDIVEDNRKLTDEEYNLLKEVLYDLR